MSYYKDAMDAIATELETLRAGGSLPGISVYEIKVRRLPHDGEHYFPGITIHPVGETSWRGTNEQEDIGYGCGLTFVQNNNNDSDYLLGNVATWRENVRRYFVENITVGSMPTPFTVKVEHGHVFDWDDLLQDNYDVSRLVLRVWSRETRT
jgi:hypothetical protein